MPIQTIDFNNTDSVTFNGQTVDEVILDGQSIWVGATHTMVVGGRELFVGKGFAFAGYAPAGVYGSGVPAYGSLSPLTINGATVAAIDSMPDSVGNNNSFWVCLYGHHAKTKFNSIVINGYTFYTSQCNHFTANDSNMGNYTAYNWESFNIAPLQLSDVGSTFALEIA